jgi:HEAT repeat protein
MPRLIIPGLLWVILSVPGAFAYPANQSMGSYIRQSGVIVLADVKEAVSSDDQARYEFREFLKGRAGIFGKKSLAIRSTCAFREDAAFARPGSTGVAVLLPERWQETECPILALYTKPEEIAALRRLIPIYSLHSERAQLEALSALMNDPNPLYSEQLFYEFNQMRDPANFPLVLDLFDRVDTVRKREVVEILKNIGDLRGVPTLLRAVQSSDSSLRSEAGWALRWHFRGAPGVDDALSKFIADTPRQPETRFQTATQCWESGKRGRGRRLFLAIANDKNEDDYVRVQSTLTIAPTLSIAERKQLQASMRLVLVRRAKNGNYLELVEAAQSLRALRSTANLDLLMALLDPKENDFIYQDTKRIATMAILDLGSRARYIAAERLVNQIVSLGKSRRIAGEPEQQLLALAWLGDETQWARVERWQWGAFSPLLIGGRQQDEGPFLIHMLRSHGDLPPRALDWIAFRLGDLGEKRAIPALIEILSKSVLPSAAHALVQLGGILVETEVTKLLTYPKHDVRVSAINILYQLQGKRMLPLLRRMIVEKDFGVKSSALLWMGHVGEPEDLKILAPMADFWTGDRANHYWAMLALAEIRKRCHYDIHGPMVYMELYGIKSFQIRIPV